MNKTLTNESNHCKPWSAYPAGILVFSFLAKRIEVAKLYHFESDRRLLFRTSNLLTSP